MPVEHESIQWKYRISHEKLGTYYETLATAERDLEQVLAVYAQTDKPDFLGLKNVFVDLGEFLTAPSEGIEYENNSLEEQFGKVILASFRKNNCLDMPKHKNSTQQFEIELEIVKKRIHILRQLLS
jgi:hypothetical protein